MRTLWIWYRVFERNGAATSGWPKVEIDLEVTFGLCNQMTVSQRLPPLDLAVVEVQFRPMAAIRALAADTCFAAVAAGERSPTYLR